MKTDKSWNEACCWKSFKRTRISPIRGIIRNKKNIVIVQRHSLIRFFHSFSFHIGTLLLLFFYILDTPRITTFFTHFYFTLTLYIQALSGIYFLSLIMPWISESLDCFENFIQQFLTIVLGLIRTFVSFHHRRCYWRTTFNSDTHPPGVKKGFIRRSNSS